MSPVVLEYNRGHEYVTIHILYLMDSFVREMTYRHRIVVQVHVLVLYSLCIIFDGLISICSRIWSHSRCVYVGTSGPTPRCAYVGTSGLTSGCVYVVASGVDPISFLCKNIW